MEPRIRSAGRNHSPGIVLAAALLGCIGGMVAIGSRRWRGPEPSLNEVQALAHARKFDQAQALLRPYLRARPDDSRAHLLKAQLATEPPTPDPDLALEHLRAVRTSGPKEVAVVKFFEGKAQYQRARYDLAEDCWREALRLDPIVAGAGWALMDLLDKEGRTDEAHRLGMRIQEIEPDPIDRVKLLLEVARIDIEKVAPGSQVQLFEPLARQHPDHVPLVLAAGLALVRDSRGEAGVELLGEARRDHPDSPDVWDAWLTGLYEASQFDRFEEEFARLPRSIADDPRFAKHEGKLAQNARDWPRAARAYRRAYDFDPADQAILYRHWFVLRQAGDTEGFARIDRVYQDYKEAYRQLRGTAFEMGSSAVKPTLKTEDLGNRRGLYYELIAMPTLGLMPQPDLYHRLADLRERMGRRDEARAWHLLVLRDRPNDAASLAALERLK
jgi:tetratricopeptide (TPR) repeat protein